MCLGSIEAMARAPASRAVSLYSQSTTVDQAGPEVLTDPGENPEPPDFETSHFHS